MKKIVEFLKDIKYELVLIVFIIFYLIFVGQRVVVNGESMMPTYHDGQNLYVNKLTRINDKYNRFDIITFYPQGRRDYILIKRVIGLPGENIKIDEQGNILINDILLEESYGAERITEGLGTDITLKEDEYFVLGDNRNHSADSRDEAVGPINIKHIIGRVVQWKKR